MNDYRTRLEAAGLFQEFAQARAAKSKDALRAVLEKAQFNALEIDSLVWSNGDIPEPPTAEEKRKSLIDNIVGRIGIAIVTGLVIGGLFVYVSMKLDKNRHYSDYADRTVADQRSLQDGVYRPFFWGFGIGAIIGLITAESFLISVLEAKWKKD